MIDSKQYEGANQLRILIIDEDDKLPENVKYFCGKKYNKVFIHANNKYKEEFKIMLRPSTKVMDYEFGLIYEYK